MPFVDQCNLVSGGSKMCRPEGIGYLLAVFCYVALFLFQVRGAVITNQMGPNALNLVS